jgi:hypothetical protein
MELIYFLLEAVFQMNDFPREGAVILRKLNAN